MKRLTIKLINESVGTLGYKNVRLLRGNGYYYWSGGIASRFKEQGVYGSPFLNSMSLQRWVSDFKDRVREIN